MKTAAAILTLAAVCSGTELTVGTKIEPLFSVKENGSFADSGKSSAGVHRAQISLLAEKISACGFTVSGELTLDASEKSTDQMIHEASVQTEFSEYITVKAGRSKPDFSRSAQIGSSKLPTIYRSWTAEHIEEDLGISGYLDGVELSGKLLKEKISWSASLNHASGDRRTGFSPQHLLSLPILSIEAEPAKGVNVRWDAAFPLYAASSVNGTVKEIRPVLFSWSAEYRAPRLYTGSFELFHGADTAEGRELKTVSETYRQNISMSIQSMHEISVPLRGKFGLFGALGAEYCNGLNRLGGAYVNRDFYWAGTAAAGAFYGKFVRFQLSADETFDELKTRNHALRLAGQLSLNGEIKIKGDSK